MKRNLLSILCIAVFTGALVYLSSFSSNESYERRIPANSVALGAQLFNDPILSGDSTVSCASCHKPEFAFSDTVAYSNGVNGHFTGRNTPTAMYIEKNKIFFWDGRAKTLEQQAGGPITNPNEMNLTIREAVQKLNRSVYYRLAFKKVFGRNPDSILLLKSIADFERSLSTYDAPYDRFLKGNDTAMNAAATRGFELFFKKNSCGNSGCHAGLSFSSDSLVNIGIFDESDKGLYGLTGVKEDIGKFKSPTLRNISLTAPYMHNGKHKTLKEVVEYYNDMDNFPLSGNTHPDVKRQRERPMTEKEINDLIEFLKALTDYRYQAKK
jgi:cytochrome c peroxidase